MPQARSGRSPRRVPCGRDHSTKMSADRVTTLPQLHTIGRLEGGR
jgi:hypothetical protein